MVQQHYENQWVIPDDYYRQRMVRFFTAAKRVAFVSERNRWAATCQLASDLPNASVIRNPISDPDCDPVAWPEPGTARFASVARLDASDKGQDLLFAVLADAALAASRLGPAALRGRASPDLLEGSRKLLRDRRPRRVPRPRVRCPWNLE